MEQLNNVLESYLNDTRALQNYIVGFCLLQSIAFLYGLDKFLSKIYKFKYLICLALLIATVTNICILVIASSYELDIIGQYLSEIEIQKSQFRIGLIEKAKWFRIILVLLINAIAMSVFFISANNHKVENTTAT